MIEIWKRFELEKLMRKYRLYSSRSYGQNFLVDRNILEKIADAAEIAEGDHLIEIGPGLGALTIMLAKGFPGDDHSGRVTAVEIDNRLIPALDEVLEGLTNIEIVNQNFMKYNLPDTRYKIIGNLPYYITTPIIAKLYEPSTQGDGKTLLKKAPSPPELAVFMMQKEVAERLLSPPGNKTYGAISVLVQYYSDIEFLFSVSREVFVPKPKVDSAVVRLRPKDVTGNDPAATERMFRLVRAGFNMRRKKLRNSLRQSGFSDEGLTMALDKAGIDPGCRAETLSPQDFYNVASFL